MDPYSIEEKGKTLLVRKAGEEKPVASLSYSLRNEPYKHLHISHTSVLSDEEKKKGHFNNLYERVEKIARANECHSIRLKTGTGDKHKVARHVFKKKGFVALQNDDPLDEARGRICLEKVLE